jgi:hypothetical protein
MNFRRAQEQKCLTSSTLQTIIVAIIVITIMIVSLREEAFVDPNVLNVRPQQSLQTL